MTVTYGRTSRTPFAFYDPDGQCLRTLQGTFPLGLIPSCVILPRSGSMCGGVLYEHPTPAPPTGGNGCSSLLPTPLAQSSHKPQSAGRTPNLIMVLLPTPVVNDMGAGKTVAQWDQWTSDMRARHGNGNGHGRSLAVEVERLLPTPVARDVKDAALPPSLDTHREGDEDTLPRAVNADHGLGAYTAAIQQWEQATRPAPPPTVERDGRPRLSPLFVEWMMGLTEGHVTGSGMTYTAQLKALGNGVVPQQASLALQLLDPL